LLEKSRFRTDVLRVPYIEWPHISDATILALVVAALVVGVIGLVVGSVVVLIFGDRGKSPLDRWATWLARSWENEDGAPIVKPGTEPTPEQKFAAVAYFLAIAAVIVWLLFRRS
jgi:cytosine/uracil/thiamine/allantoin permease